MNPQWHDEFVTLCALFPSGELTEEEWALLQVHLAYCDSCRVAFEEYQHLASDVMPAMAASAYAESDNRPESSFSLEAAEQRLMSQVNSAPPHPSFFLTRKTTWRVAGGIAASAVGVACLIGLYFLRLKPQRTPQAVVVAHVEGASKPSVLAKPETDLRPALELAERQVARLQQQLSAEVGQYRQSSSTAANSEQQLEGEQAGREKISKERDSLTRQLAAAQIEAQSLRDKSAEAGATTAQQSARTRRARSESSRAECDS